MQHAIKLTFIICMLCYSVCKCNFIKSPLLLLDEIDSVHDLQISDYMNLNVRAMNQFKLDDDD